MQHWIEPAQERNALKRVGSGIGLFLSIFVLGFWLLSAATRPSEAAPAPPPLAEVSTTIGETKAEPAEPIVRVQNLMDAERPGGQRGGAVAPDKLVSSR